MSTQQGQVSPSRIEETGLTMDRCWAMPNSATFTIPPIRELVAREVGDCLWIDPFAGETRIPGVDVTNDLNPEIDTDRTLRALDFLRCHGGDGEVDGGVLLDPPYSPRQIAECYNDVGLDINREDTQASWWTQIKEEVRRVTAPGATVITCGWQSGGVGLTKRHIRLVAHGGWHDDTIVTVEDRAQATLPSLGGVEQ